MRVFVPLPLQSFAVSCQKSYGRTPWGIFGNVFDREDRKLSSWYAHFHTPWFVLEIYRAWS
jgi:hypothetical protein